MLQTSPTHRMARAGRSVPAAPPTAPKVSVVMPTRNRAFCLGEAIDSIRAQTFADWELIVVDDGSEDETGDVMRRYCAQDSRIRHVRQPHGGVARALNTGLRLVRGDYLFKLDDDDVALPHLLATCAAGLDARPDHWAANFRNNVFGGNHDSGWTLKRRAFGILLFFRVSALRRLKGWNELYALYEDSDLRIRASVSRGWRIWYCKDLLYEYRRSDQANSNHRVDALATFAHRYMIRRNTHLARWGLSCRMLGAQTLQEAVAGLCAAHRRTHVLPSASFAHWQKPVLKEVRAAQLLRKLRRDMLSLLKGRPRFPWAPLWRAERTLWRRLQLLRMPLMRRAEAMWDLARHHYFRRKETK